MGSKGKIFIAAIGVLVVANYSKVVESTFGTVKRSVGTIELARIDKALWQHHTMTELGSPDTGAYHFPQNQEHFEKVLQGSFDTPGRDPTKDQWGRTFQYKPSADKKGYALLSFGPDGEGATDDDLWLERRERNVTMSCGLDRIENDMTAEMDSLAKAKREWVDELKKAPKEAEPEEADKPEGDTAASARSASIPDPGETHWSEEVGDAAEDAVDKVEATVSAIVEKTKSLTDPGEAPPDDLPPEPEGAPAQPAAAAQPSPAAEEPPEVKPASAVPSTPPPPPPPTVKPPSPRKLSPRQTRQAKRLLVCAKNFAINNRGSTAKRYYQQLIDDFPGTSYAQQAKEALAELGK